MLRSVKYGICGAVLAGLVAAPAVWASTDKSVELIVDGHGHKVHTSAERVGTVVKEAGFRLTPHDLIAPSAGAPVHDGEHIVLRRGRLLNLDVDGRKVAVWTTAPTVHAALAQLGYSTSDFVSVSRSQRLPLKATRLAIRTPHSVLVVHDGKQQRVTTTVATVGDLFGSLNITVGTYDRLSAPLTSRLATNQTLVLKRVENKLTSRTVKVPFATTKQKEPKLFAGETKVVRDGRKGSARQTFLSVYVDGKLTATSLVGEQSVKDARAKIVAVGTRKVTGSGPEAAQAIARILLAKRGWSNQYSCLENMWNRESRWNIHAANASGAYGIPQALPGSKMSSAGSDWQDSAVTQIKWGLGYIADRYHTPCEAWSFWQGHNYY